MCLAMLPTGFTMNVRQSAKSRSGKLVWCKLVINKRELSTALICYYITSVASFRHLL